MYMQVQENISLKPYHTFGINVSAGYMAVCNNAEEIKEIFDFGWKRQLPHLVLGGGSNVLFTKDFDGMIIRNEIKGKEIVRETEDRVWLKVGAGENWHQLVLYAVQQGWGGIENLALIPGCVGASPIQNIGAYGIELKESFFELEAWHLYDECKLVFDNKGCGFGYRDSIFKHAFKGNLLITSVTLQLDKKPVLNTSYAALQQELEKAGVVNPTIADVCNAVIRIRSSKLPDPKLIGNAGSFFKNPVVSHERFGELKAEYPNISAFASGNHYKLAAGWLIEQCGWKGFRRGDAGCHDKQALVLVNHGTATGEEIWQLSQDILDSVKEKFGVELEREVNIV